MLLHKYRHRSAKQSLAQVDANRLDLGVVLQRIRAQLAAKARLLVATEGRLVVDHVVVVDPDGTAQRQQKAHWMGNSLLVLTLPAGHSTRG